MFEEFILPFSNVRLKNLNPLISSFIYNFATLNALA